MGPFCTGSHDMAVGAWCKRRKHRGGRNTSTLRAACRKMDLLYVRCREEFEDRQRLAALLAEVYRRSNVPTPGRTDLPWLAENLAHLYFVANNLYSAEDFHLEVCVKGWQGHLAGSQNVELFVMRVSHHAKY